MSMIKELDAKKASGSFSKSKSSNDSKKEFEEIIKNERIDIHFQSIVTVSDREVFGFESLTRGPVTGRMHKPHDLFYQTKKIMYWIS